MFDVKALQAFNRTLQVDVSKLNAEASSALLAKTARGERDRVLREQGARAGQEPSYRQVVDGREGADLDTVRPDGVIVFEWQYLAEVVTETMKLLVERSPKGDAEDNDGKPGGFIEGLKVYADEAETEVAAVPADAAVVEIIATVVYSRRLEMGTRKGGGPFVLEVEPHIVQETAQVARRLFGNVADIRFAYVNLAGSPVRHPSIRIVARGA